MSVERELGQITSTLKHIAEDVREVKANMVSKDEFLYKVKEHDDFRSGIKHIHTRIDQVEIEQARFTWVKRLAYVLAAGWVAFAGKSLLGV